MTSGDWISAAIQIVGTVTAAIVGAVSESEATEQAVAIAAVQQERKERKEERIEKREAARTAKGMRLAEKELDLRAINDRWQRRSAERTEKRQSMDRLLAGTLQRGQTSPLLRATAWDVWSGRRRAA